MARAHFVKAARKDNQVAKKGESYWWWQFRFGGKYYSKTQPRPSQLTQSEFYGEWYSAEEDIEDVSFETHDDAMEFLEDLKDRITMLGDECQDKLDNMPEQLQDSDTGQLLQERIEACEEWVSNLDSIDTDDRQMSLEDLKEEIASSNPGCPS